MTGVKPGDPHDASGSRRRTSTRPASSCSSTSWWSSVQSSPTNSNVAFLILDGIDQQPGGGFLTDQKIRRGTHKSVQAFEADICSWIADWNDNPRPFIWTKTAEEILDSLTRFCRRISGAAQ